MTGGGAGSRPPPQAKTKNGKIDRKGFGFHGLMVELMNRIRRMVRRTGMDF